MEDSQELVWYVCYGSNLLEERFFCYIQGGTVPGRSFVNRGCTDTTLPLRNEALEIPNTLYFGGQSHVYEGGVGFITSGPGTTPAKVRAYLITTSQFWEVVAQENRLEHALEPRPLDAVHPKHGLHLHELDQVHSQYNSIVHCGELDGYPMLSFTTSEQHDHANAPSVTYLITIAKGLQQSHGMSTAAITDYFADLAGVAGHYSRSDLLRLLSESLHSF